MKNLPYGLVYDELDVADQIVWHPKKEELNSTEQFFAKVFGGLVDYMRSIDEKSAIAQYTADQIIEMVKKP